MSFSGSQGKLPVLNWCFFECSNKKNVLAKPLLMRYNVAVSNETATLKTVNYYL